MTRAGGLFDASGPKVYSLPPSASFLDELARGLIDACGARTDPAALADAIIFVPNRRSARELSLSFYRELGNGLIIPSIRTLGDVDEEDSAASIGAEALGLPPAVSTPRRRGALANLIQAWRRAQEQPELPPGSALAAADELAALLDQSAVSEAIDWSELSNVELEAHLAAHWKVSADFLKIVAEAWPNWLAEQGAMDPLARRRAAATALAEKWETNPPDHPVIIAGSTGATAASRRLMKAVASLPMGVIVLPGLDPELNKSGWLAVKDAPSHPQFAFERTLRTLAIDPRAVPLWPGVIETGLQSARRRLINESLAPAETTSGWTQRLKDLAEPGDPKTLVGVGLSGLRIVEAEDEAEEALVAALLLRETLETPDRTAALAAPDSALGRRVGAILERWGLDISPSAGAPLNRTLPGGYILLLLRWAQDPSDPVLLLSLLKHPLTSLGRSRQQLDAIIAATEVKALRGPRKWPDLEGLAHHILHLHDELPKGWPQDHAALLRSGAAIVEEIAIHHTTAAQVFSGRRIEGAVAAETCSHLAMSLAANPQSPEGQHVWAGRDGAQTATFLEQLAAVCHEMGGVDADFWPQFAEAVMQGMSAAPDAAEHPRIAIWGPLEARLQRRDRVIIAGLNEGSWPALPGADAFLNRILRRKLGFADADERIGLSAHDFAQLANAPDVILLRAKRVEDKPAVDSRWIWRLRTLAAGGLGSQAAANEALASAPDHDPVRWARRLRIAQKVEPARPPEPRPPVEARKLDSFSPSRVVQLIRDPYADYARRVLGLEALRRVGEPVDARERGTAVHAAIENYERNGGSLEDLIVEELVAAGATEELIALERTLWLRAADFYLDWSAARAPSRINSVLEETAKLTFASAAGETTLRATADRVEQLTDGTLAIIDFKTGRPKTAAQVQTGLEPQLSLEGAIAQESGFGAIKAAPVSQIIYFQFSTSKAVLNDDNGQPLVFEDAGTSEVVDESLKGLKRLIAGYAKQDTPYRSKPRAEFAWDYGDYDRLARRKEWTIEDGGEE